MKLIGHDLVGMEFRNTRDDSLYAATPPIEALRTIVSWAVTKSHDGGPRNRDIMMNDVSRTYLYALAGRDIYIELPNEDEFKNEGFMGKLRLCLYGTRDAAKM